MVGLVRDHLRQTVLYREAVAMGLDKDDVIIRRRMAQKLEFLAQDLIQPEEPTEEELQAFFKRTRSLPDPAAAHIHPRVPRSRQAWRRHAGRCREAQGRADRQRNVPNEASDLGTASCCRRIILSETRRS